MATSRSTPSSEQKSKASTNGLAAGSGPDLSGSLPAPKSPTKSRSKSSPPEGASTQGKPEEGLSAAKPVSKAKGKSAPAAKTQKGTGGTAPVTAGASQEGGPTQAVESVQAVGSAEPVQSPAAPTGERMSDVERQRRIAERAYHKAQERGFGGERHLDDWLEAEREHDQSS